MKKIYRFAILFLSAFVIMAPVSCKKQENREEQKETTETPADKPDPDPEEGPGEEGDLKEPWFITRGLILSWYDVNKSDVIDYVDIEPLGIAKVLLNNFRSILNIQLNFLSL